MLHNWIEGLVIVDPSLELGYLMMSIHQQEA